MLLRPPPACTPPSHVPLPLLHTPGTTDTRPATSLSTLPIFPLGTHHEPGALSPATPTAAWRSAAAQTLLCLLLPSPPAPLLLLLLPLLPGILFSLPSLLLFSLFTKTLLLFFLGVASLFNFLLLTNSLLIFLFTFSPAFLLSLKPSLFVLPLHLLFSFSLLP